MKTLIAVIVFVATLGGLFLVENYKANKPQEENYARIIEALKEENADATVSATPSPIKARIPTPTPILTPVRTPTPTPALTQTPSQTPTLVPISPS